MYGFELAGMCWAGPGVSTRYAAERAELLAQRDVIDQQLGMIEAKVATVQVVIGYDVSLADYDIDPTTRPAPKGNRVRIRALSRSRRGAASRIVTARA